MDRKIIEDEPVSLLQAKSHLNVTHDLDDDLIKLYIQSARDYIENYINQIVTVSEFSDYDELNKSDLKPVISENDNIITAGMVTPPESIKIAMLLLIGHFYTNRENTVYEKSSAVDALLIRLKSYE